MATLALANAWLAVALLACSENHNGNPADEDAAVEENGSEPPPNSQKDGGKPPPKPEKDAGPDMDSAVPPKDAGDPDASTPEQDAEVEPDAQVEPDAEVDASEPEPPLTLGELTVDTTAEDLEAEIDLFGVWGHRFWVEIDEAQVEKVNQGYYGGGGGYGDIYTPGGSNAAYAEHVLVQNAATDSVADYGKVEVFIIGGASFRPFDRQNIPNLRLDTDEFEMDKRIGSFEHLRFSNGIVGSIFRDQIVYRIYRELGYPAARAGYAFLGSSVWGEGVWVPMILTEVYKRKFCEDNAEALGGTCENMWEFPSDLVGYYPGEGYDVVPPEWCQVNQCDNTRLEDFMGVLAQTQRGPGFRDAIAEYVDWPRFHQFQCMSWLLATGDDHIHGGNNTVIFERDDGKFVFEPYSVDHSTGIIGDVELTGQTVIADGCQKDPECWADTIEVCEDLVVAFDELNPEHFVDETVDGLTELGMMRNGDDGRAEELRNWLIDRQELLPTRIERYRYLPDGNGNCPNDLQLCGDGGCGTAEQCELRQCSYGEWCPSRQQCIEPYYESCPSCPEETPYYCGQTSECTDDLSSCYSGYCDEYPPGYEYCPAYGSCEPIGSCPMIDEDGGVGGPIGGGKGGIAFPEPMLPGPVR